MRSEDDDMETVQVRRWTRDEYEKMLEAGVFSPDERVELIDGEILKMTPQKSALATAISLTGDALRTAFDAGYHVRTQLPLAVDPYSEPEPDVAVVLGRPRDYRLAHPATALLIVEVADATLRHDRKRKGSLYARAGVPEYWIVNLLDRRLELYRDPVLATEARYGWEYQTVRLYASEQEVAPLGATHARIAVQDLLP